MIDRWWVSEKRLKNLNKTIGTLGKGIMVGNTIEKAITCIKIRVGIMIEGRKITMTGGTKMTIRKNMTFMFNQGSMILILEPHGWKVYWQN